MKKGFIILSAIMLMASFYSCTKDTCTTEREFFEYEPIWMTSEEIHAQTIIMNPARELKNPGKIYYYGNVLFISDRGEGVHIIDNTDKENPIFKAFIEIPGNEDISFKGHHLIADSYFDILVVDLSNLEQPTVVSRIEDVEKNYAYDESKDSYIVGYQPTTKTRTISCNHPDFEQEYFYYGDYFYATFETAANIPFSQIDFDSNGGFFNNSGSATGIAGSLSSFAIVGDYFYFINHSNVHVYNIADMTNPFFADGFEVAWNIETLFPYEDKLFIGGQNGMYIYDNTNPESPVYLSEFIHARACDPVFVQGTTAYITLRDGTTCQNFTNQLDVVDVSDILNPTLIKSYDMYNPRGLSVYENTLIICDEKAGIKIYDTTDKQAITSNKLGKVQGITAHEVIHISPTCIITVAEEGIYQHDISDPSSPVLLSVLEVAP